MKFGPGQSGNPAGRPKSRELREALRGHVEIAAKRLTDLVNHKNPRVALLAIRELFDRVYGRPLQSSEVTLEDNRTGLSESLTSEEVAVSLSNILTEAEKQMGLEPMLNSQNSERVERILQQPTPIPPVLYEALHRAGGTRH